MVLVLMKANVCIYIYVYTCSCIYLYMFMYIYIYMYILLQHDVGDFQGLPKRQLPGYFCQPRLSAKGMRRSPGGLRVAPGKGPYQETLIACKGLLGTAEAYAGYIRIVCVHIYIYI